MIVRISHWFVGRSLREQRMLLVMLAIALPLLAWLLLIRPMSGAYDAALTRHLESVDRFGRVAALAELAKAAPARPAVPGGDLILQLTDGGRQAGVNLVASAGGSADQALITIDSAHAATALGWIETIERQGYAVDPLVVTPKGDGQVSVQATVTREGR